MIPRLSWSPKANLADVFWLSDGGSVAALCFIKGNADCDRTSNASRDLAASERRSRRGLAAEMDSCSENRDDGEAPEGICGI